ncbi:MAG: DUF4384 domain-containing protein [Fidelibacterota bacterium]|nr:MAG: DUF4384 domain-containing protein [Candidatus Neomarinimicrobiota bacterium]
MRLLQVVILSGFLVAGCSSKPRDTGPEGEGPDQSQTAAERAFVELEGGEVVPLPAVAPVPDEEALLKEARAGAETRASTERLEYEVKEGWFLVDTTLVFPASVSPQKARQQVLQIARGAGLEQALPQKVSFTSLLSDIMDETAGAAFEKSTWSTFALSSVTGHLVDEKILSTDLQQLEGGAYRYRIVLEARVVPVKGERDPSLRLELELNERLLKAGDELIVRARSSTDGYLYVFNFLSDNSVMLMFPSTAMPDNTISAGEWLETPTRQERSRGIHYRVSADPGAPTTNETIYTVFTRQPIADLSDLLSVPEGNVSFSAGDKSFTDFQRWLAEIPLGQRIEKAVQFHIVSEKE